jgi:hypothetical protein
MSSLIFEENVNVNIFIYYSSPILGGMSHSRHITSSTNGLYLNNIGLLILRQGLIHSFTSPHHPPPWTAAGSR